ncbi:hypothetical protein BDZ89DRAFT_1079107 [Hymenopellis radicata]|nr:hypothetical protein BDZ89DRAFT_1079107 [Hymenopellis radicata]
MSGLVLTAHSDSIPMHGRATSVAKKIIFQSSWGCVDPESSCESEENGKFERTKSHVLEEMMSTWSCRTISDCFDKQSGNRLRNPNYFPRHEYLYERGVLHHDVSADNIMVAWCDGEDYLCNVVAKGALIESHSAQYGTDRPVHDVPANFPAMDRGPAERRASFFPDMMDYEAMGTQTIVNADVFLTGSEAVRRTSLDAYVLDAWKHVSRFTAVGAGHVIDSSLLRWTKVSRKFSFKFTDEELQSGSLCTGTLSYTSGEILSPERYYYPIQSGESDLFHDAVHDIESVFWVLIHICLTRSGPGVQQREELTEDSQAHEQLRSVVYRFFDADRRVLAFNKRKLFIYRGDFGESIFQSFHPYFDELKPFMREWFSLLVLAYGYVEGYEYHNIHSRVQDILERALDSVTPEKMDFDVSREEDRAGETLGNALQMQT